SPEEATRRTEEERDVREEVERDAATEPHCGHRVELVADVAKSRLEAESEEDDAGDHREVEIAVRVAREPCLLDTGRLPEPRPREDRGHVEVEPPERRDDDDREPRGDDDSRRQLEAGTDAARNDRLAQGDEEDKTGRLPARPGRTP